MYCIVNDQFIEYNNNARYLGYSFTADYDVVCLKNMPLIYIILKRAIIIVEAIKFKPDYVLLPRMCIPHKIIS